MRDRVLRRLRSMGDQGGGQGGGQGVPISPPLASSALFRGTLSPSSGAVVEIAADSWKWFTQVFHFFFPFGSCSKAHRGRAHIFKTSAAGVEARLCGGELAKHQCGPLSVLSAA